MFSGVFVFISKDSGLANGPETMWDSESQAIFDEICADATTDKEFIAAAYNWILNNLTYDDNYRPAYQCFSVKRTLSLKSGNPNGFHRSGVAEKTAFILQTARDHIGTDFRNENR